uniref:Uncharacterized protein n=1 Tax=Tetranychus urticae TaxID=32264 RepID=T1KZA8_TETUR
MKFTKSNPFPLFTKLSLHEFRKKYEKLLRGNELEYIILLRKQI